MTLDEKEALINWGLFLIMIMVSVSRAQSAGDYGAAGHQAHMQAGARIRTERVALPTAVLGYRASVPVFLNNPYTFSR